MRNRSESAINTVMTIALLSILTPGAFATLILFTGSVTAVAAAPNLQCEARK